MIPTNQSPAEGATSDRPEFETDTTAWDESNVRWFVSPEPEFHSEALETAGRLPNVYFELAEAIHAAQQRSADEGGLSMYVWHWPQPQGERQATAIVSQGQTYLSPVEIEAMVDFKQLLEPGEQGEQGHGDRIEEPINWAVSEGDDYYNWVNCAREPEALSTTHFVYLSDALTVAKKQSHQGVPQYVWAHPAPEGEREAIAVAIDGVLYRKDGGEVNRHANSPTNSLRSAYPWTFSDHGESTMDVGLTKRELFVLEMAKSMVNAVYPISHNGPNTFIDSRWPLMRDGAIRMADDLFKALADDTDVLQVKPPRSAKESLCEELLAELRGDKA